MNIKHTEVLKVIWSMFVSVGILRYAFDSRNKQNI